MKYLFKFPWLFAVKPMLALVLSGLFYTTLTLLFLIILLWELNLNEALKAFQIKWYAQHWTSRTKSKYWYYETPIHAFYGERKWTEQAIEHML